MCPKANKLLTVIFRRTTHVYVPRQSITSARRSIVLPFGLPNLGVDSPQCLYRSDSPNVIVAGGAITKSVDGLYLAFLRLTSVLTIEEATTSIPI